MSQRVADILLASWGMFSGAHHPRLCFYSPQNERLFREMYKAYREGRSDSNPADSWYKGDIGFFDFYIIPLSKKLRDCGVFGPTSDENLNYATNNRNMWVKNGEQITKEMLERAEREYEYMHEEVEAAPLDEPLLGT